jgi:hypothetical protein
MPGDVPVFLLKLVSLLHAYGQKRGLLYILGFGCYISFFGTANVQEELAQSEWVEFPGRGVND